MKKLILVALPLFLLTSCTKVPVYNVVDGTTTYKTGFGSHSDEKKMYLTAKCTEVAKKTAKEMQKKMMAQCYINPTPPSIADKFVEKLVSACRSSHSPKNDMNFYAYASQVPEIVSVTTPEKSIGEYLASFNIEPDGDFPQYEGFSPQCDKARQAAINKSNKIASQENAALANRMNKIIRSCENNCGAHYTNQHYDRCLDSCIADQTPFDDIMKLQQIQMQSYANAMTKFADPKFLDNLHNQVKKAYGIEK